jgi:hypothetical protein
MAVEEDLGLPQDRLRDDDDDDDDGNICMYMSW